MENFIEDHLKIINQMEMANGSLKMEILLKEITNKKFNLMKKILKTCQKQLLN